VEDDARRVDHWTQHGPEPFSQTLRKPGLKSLGSEVQPGKTAGEDLLPDIPEQALNAFATGRNPEHGVVAVTEGILRALSRDELEGVLSHELSHIKHRDILTGTIVATIAGASA
jgi:hypothetical protein